MTIFKRVFGFALVCCLCITLSACNSTTGRISNNLHSNLNRLSGLMERTEEASENDLPYGASPENNSTVSHENPEFSVLPMTQNTIDSFETGIQEISESAKEICAEIETIKNHIRNQISLLRQAQFKMESGEKTLDESQFHICKDTLSSLNESCNKLSLSRGEVKTAAKSLRKMANQTQENGSLKAKYAIFINSLVTRKCNYQNTSNLLDTLMDSLMPNGIESLYSNDQVNQISTLEKKHQNSEGSQMPENNSRRNAEQSQSNQYKKIANRSQNAKQNSIAKNNAPGFRRRPFKIPDEWKREKTLKEPFYQEPATTANPAVEPGRNSQQPKTGYAQKNHISSSENTRQGASAQSNTPNYQTPVPLPAALPNYEIQNNSATYSANDKRENNTIVDVNNLNSIACQIQSAENEFCMPGPIKMQEQTNLQLEQDATILRPAQEKKMYHALSDGKTA